MDHILAVRVHLMGGRSTTTPPTRVCKWLDPREPRRINDHLGWEQSCAQGFRLLRRRTWKRTRGAGLGHSVIRSGAEMNGTWEADYVGTTTHEQSSWARVSRRR